MTTEQEMLIELIISEMKSAEGRMNIEKLFKTGRIGDNRTKFLAAKEKIKAMSLAKIESFAQPDIFILLPDGEKFTTFEELKRKEEEKAISEWFNSENAKTQYEDYPTLRKKANTTFVIAIITAILLVVELVLKLLHII